MNQLQGIKGNVVVADKASSQITLSGVLDKQSETLAEIKTATEELEQSLTSVLIPDEPRPTCPDPDIPGGLSPLVGEAIGFDIRLQNHFEHIRNITRRLNIS